MTVSAPVKRVIVERNVIELAIVGLSEVCDGATTHDNKGYNGADTDYGKSLAEHIGRNRLLTIRQAKSAVKMLQKYRKQLASMGLETPTTDDLENLYNGKNPRRIEIIENEIAVFLPNLQQLIDNNGFDFDYCNGRIEDNSIRFSIEYAEPIWAGVSGLGIELSDEFRLLVMDCGF